MRGHIALVVWIVAPEPSRLACGCGCGLGLGLRLGGKVGGEGEGEGGRGEGGRGEGEENKSSSPFTFFSFYGAYLRSILNNCASCASIRDDYAFTIEYQVISST